MTTHPHRGRGASTHAQRAEIVAEICRRIESGERLIDILRDDGMPQMPTFHAWVGRSRELDDLYQAAKAQRRLPVRSLMSSHHLYCPELGRDFCDRLSRAMSVKEVCAQEGMPCETTVYRWCREESDFGDWYRAARECQAHQKFDLAWEIAESRCWSGVSGARLAVDTLKWQVAKLAPEHYGTPKEMAANEGPPIINVKVVRFGRPKSERGDEMPRNDLALTDGPSPRQECPDPTNP
jgi:hypothetical protein